MPVNGRRKGASAEREYRDELRRHGFEARRDGQIHESYDRPNEDLLHNVPDTHIEVKRRETLAIPQWVRQTEEDARGREPVVAFRQSRQPWRVVVRSDHYLSLRREILELRARLRALEGG